MAAVLVALLLSQEPDLFGDPSAPVEEPAPPPGRVDPPAPIPPPDGPVPDGVPKGEDAPPLEPHVPLPKDEQRALLQEERLHLLEASPSLGPPAIFATLSGVAMVIGVVLTLVGLPAALRGQPPGTFIVGAPVMFLGLGGFGFGVVWGRETALDREEYDDRIHEIEKELGW